MGWLASFLANKIVAPAALIGCLALAIFGGWQYVAKNNYRSDLSALQAQNLQAKLDAATANLKLVYQQNAVLSDSNKDLSGKVADLTARNQSLQDRINAYVPKKLVTACVPMGLVLVLDAAGTGADPSSLPTPSDELNSRCSDVSVPQATDTLVYDLGLIPILKARIENARDTWEAQRELTLK